jgi:hypothetical protein
VPERVVAIRRLGEQRRAALRDEDVAAGHGAADEVEEVARGAEREDVRRVVA